MSSRKFSQSRRRVLAGGAALVLSGAAVATVRAQQQPEPAPVNSLAPVNEDVLFFGGPPDAPLAGRRDAWLKAVADKLGVTPERLDQAIQDASKEVGLPLLLPPAKLATGVPGEPGQSGTFSIRVDSDLATAAKAMGISEDQLRTEAANKSLTDVARAHNVDPKVVAEALKAQRRADIDKAVADGKLPSTFADRLKSHLDDEIDRLMRLPGFRGNLVFRFEQRTEP
jgi:hypothetical protein